jgi:tetratricopeptide (TPR) repeat protein
MRTCQNGLRIDPSWAEGHKLLGALQFGAKQHAQAAASLKKGLELSGGGDSANVRGMLAMAYLETGQLADGAREYSAAIRLDPAIAKHYVHWLTQQGGKLVQAACERGRVEEAMRLVKTLTGPLEAAAAAGAKAEPLATTG